MATTSMDHRSPLNHPETDTSLDGNVRMGSVPTRRGIPTHELPVEKTCGGILRLMNTTSISVTDSTGVVCPTTPHRTCSSNVRGAITTTLICRRGTGMVDVQRATLPRYRLVIRLDMIRHHNILRLHTTRLCMVLRLRCLRPMPHRSGRMGDPRIQARAGRDQRRHLARLRLVGKMRIPPRLEWMLHQTTTYMGLIHCRVTLQLRKRCMGVQR